MHARCLLASLLLTLAVWAQAEERVLFDFEAAELPWKAYGANIEVGRAAVLEAPLKRGSPAGSALDIVTEADNAAASLKGTVPSDWRGFKEINFWMYRGAEEAKRVPVTVFEVQLYEDDGKTRFWRKSEHSGAGWKKFTIPLKWFRPTEERIARWNRIARIGFYFRDAARVQIDVVSVATGDDPLQSSQPSEQDLRELAFPGVNPKSIFTASKKEFLILSNAKDLQIDKLADELAKVIEAVREDFPFLEEQISRPVLLVFATRKEFETFTPRLAERLNARATVPPGGDGYTLNAIATSFWDPQWGTLRPVYVHEFVHSLLERKALLPNIGEWFHEGLAVRYQFRFHPQANLPQIMPEILGESNLTRRIEKLTNGKELPFGLYLPALSVVEFLLEDEKLKPRLPALVAEFQKTGNTDLNRLFGGEVIAQDVATFTAEWAAWCREKYQ